MTKVCKTWRTILKFAGSHVKNNMKFQLPYFYLYSYLIMEISFEDLLIIKLHLIDTKTFQIPRK
jgi:hypothetical protein